MHLMLQQALPDDFVVAGGESHTVREFCEIAFAEAGLDYRDYVRIDERFYRPAEVDSLVGDATKARSVLGWTPSYSFTELVTEMVRNDIDCVMRNPGTRAEVAQEASQRRREH
jgi:GDPmannose 4,6-dehydratase